MSGPRTKRQFAGAASDPAQRRITSFFTGSASSSTLLDNASTWPDRELNPTDASVQSNLLSVGMRVRKAVPEGYKTGTYSAFSLWDEGSKDTTPTSPSQDPGRSRANAFSTPRELLPFCGIHRIGGLDTQGSWDTNDIFSRPLAASIPSVSFDADTMDDVPGLTLSQESNESNDSGSPSIAGARTRKRFFVDDDDEEPLELPGRWAMSAFQDGEVSPRSLTPAGWSNSRILAVPRKGKLMGKLSTAGTEGVGQENVMIVNGDFEEASFLDSSFEVDMDDV